MVPFQQVYTLLKTHYKLTLTSDHTGEQQLIIEVYIIDCKKRSTCGSKKAIRQLIPQLGKAVN